LLLRFASEAGKTQHQKDRSLEGQARKIRIAGDTSILA